MATTISGTAGIDTPALIVGTGGIQIGGTGSANKLDDYEEGTWTPVIAFGGNSVSAAYDNSVRGNYTKVGNLVTVTVRMVLTSKGSSTGSATVRGLPFTATSNAASTSGGCIGDVAGLTFANQLLLRIGDSTTFMEVQEVTEGGSLSALTNSNFTDSTRLSWSATYRAQ